MARKRRMYRYPDEFRMAAIRRVLNGELQKDVARDLDILPNRIWLWQKQLAQGVRAKPQAPPITPEELLRKEAQQLKELLVKKELELNFFKGALQKVEARRQPSPGAQVSTSKSAK